MLPHARHEYLIRQLELHGSIRASEIAEALDVSPVTIRRDIDQLADKGLMERVHGGALSLARQTSRPDPARTLIGAVVPLRNFYYPEVVHGMELVASRMRARLILGVAGYQPETERSRVERLLSLGVQGLILTPSHLQNADDVASWLTAIPVPVVLLERHVNATSQVRQIDSVRTDHTYGAELAVEHLRDLGHERIGLAVDTWTPTAPWIQQGYLQVAARLAMEPVPVVELPSDPNDIEAITNAANQLIDEYLRTGVTGLLVHSDHHAIQIAEVCQLRGLRVPEDMAIVSYDDVLAAHAAVPLTAVTPPRVELGREALRMVMTRVERPDEAAAPHHLQLLPRLTVRQSTAPAPASA
ncbi:DeoR/GlpR family transcriptional regulator [Ruania alkalisoli]|uniref:DeoR/GlpR family transcriptional regulator n=1 Tax=Ruania alkalisoli TaxID=2779775 RepID=A0A7M1STL5_9MICO|nr:substrate-binding domain-containing protein [Ruania alkalisoli]QOR70112.1 DeoR/GlpR family transcriptional regulator [Ruania alkalisoli]